MTSGYILQITVVLLGSLATLHGAIIPEDSVKIVGGTPASPGEFPFMVSLQVKGRGDVPNTHTCGATLYSLSRIITSASCVETKVASNFVVVVGAYTMDDAVKGHQQYRNVKSITLHPDYNVTQNHDDIAVLDLTTPFVESETITSLPLASRHQVYPEHCVIAGWGYTNDLNLSDKLMKGTVNLYDKNYCVSNLPPAYNPDRMLCGNGVNENDELVDSCTGDRGGPLICKNSDKSPYLAGVISWGHLGCYLKEKPGVYMEIAKYRNWLDSLANGQEDEGSLPSRTTTPVPEVPPVSSSNTKEDSTITSTSTTRRPLASGGSEGEGGRKPVQSGCRRRVRK